MASKRKRLNCALLDAVIVRDIAQVRELLKQGADVKARDNEHEETPLILAAKFAGAGMMRLLLEAGADVHARDEEGNTILMRKVSESASLAEAGGLLRLGVDPNVRNEAGETALDLAESLGLVKVVEQLRSGAG